MIFDLKSVSRDALLVDLNRLEQKFGPLTLVRHSDETLEAVPVAKPTSDLQGMAQFGNVVRDAVREINLKDRTMSITGASNLGANFKDAISRAKAKIEAAQSAVVKASDSVNAAADQAVKTAAQMEAEAADLIASLGQATNFPPE